MPNQSEKLVPRWRGCHAVTGEESPSRKGYPPSILWIGPSSGTHFDGASSKNTLKAPCRPLLAKSAYITPSGFLMITLSV